MVAWPVAWTAALLVLGGASLVPAREAPAVHTEPSALTKTLRALGLDVGPGVRGDKAYRQGDYEDALRQYGSAVAETPADAPERGLLNLNIGNALYRQQRWPEAAEAYGQALKQAGRDSGFSARVHHNLGNTFFRKAEAAGPDQPAAAGPANPEAAIADLREAVAHYKKALRLNTRSAPSKQNLELATARLQRLLEQQQQQQQQQQQENRKQPPPSPRAQEALARALQLTQERRYAEASAVLTDIMQRDRTASSFAAHLKRLEDVQKIMRGEKPAATAPGDPRATPWNPGAPARTPDAAGGRRTP
jgi:tetratricopeptide (TPR) repeat protein